MMKPLLFSLALLASASACSEDSASDASNPAAHGGTSAPAARATASGPFEMTVADVFTISGRGVVLTGRVASGTVSLGDTVCIAGGPPLKVTGLELFRKELVTLTEGDTGGLLLKDLAKDEVNKGDVIRGC